MKTVLEKNCFKKVKANKQRKLMTEIGANAFVVPEPKVKVGMHKTQTTKYAK